MQENIFYNYIYLDPRKPGNYNYQVFHFDYEPFYVGKGQGGRCYNHLNETKNRTCNLKKFYKVQKILKQGLEPIVLKIYENLEEPIAFQNEIDLIKIIGRHDKKLGPLVNLTNGGDGGSGRIYICSDETRYKLSQCFIKKVYQYDLDGNLIKEYKSVKSAYKETNIKHIATCCRGVYKQAGNFIWSYHELLEDEKVLKINNVKRKEYDDSSRDRQKVYQYTLDGNLIKEYKSAMEASIATGINNGRITTCCNNYNKTTGNFIWSYNILDKDDISNRNDKRNKSIIQYDSNNNFIAEYNSIADAVKYTNIKHCNISNCCLGRQMSAGGFKWNFK